MRDFLIVVLVALVVTLLGIVAATYKREVGMLIQAAILSPFSVPLSWCLLVGGLSGIVKMSIKKTW